jgi:uncharacterized membrane protein
MRNKNFLEDPMTVQNPTSSQASRQERARAGQTIPLSPQSSQRSEGRQTNGDDRERAVSMAAGSIVTLLGLSRRSIPGALIAGVGGALLYHGATGRWPAADSLNLKAPGAGGQAAERGVHISQAMLIQRPAEQLYGFWRNFENLPQIMTHLESVRTTEGGRSHWVARMQSMGGKRMEWDAEITRDEPNRAIAWRSLPGSDIDTMGEIRFQKAMGDRGTEVHVEMDYVPPGGKLGHMLASLMGDNPKRVIREDLRNFKRLMEIGEILTIIGQPHGTCTGEGKPYTESQWKPFFR